MGSLSAGQIDFWVQEVRGAGDGGRGAREESRESRVESRESDSPLSTLDSQLAPHPSSLPLAPRPKSLSSAVPQGQVRLESATFSAAVGEMQAWFKKAAAGWEPVPEGSAPAGSPTAHPAAGAAPPTAQPGEALPGTAFPRGGRSLEGALVVARPAPRPAANWPSWSSNRASASCETQTAEPGAKARTRHRRSDPRARRVQAHDVGPVTGNLAHVEGRGMSMSGPNIHVNCGTNQLARPRPGRMELPMDRDFQGGGVGARDAGRRRSGPAPTGRQRLSPAEPVPLVIVWQHGMVLERGRRRDSSNRSWPQPRPADRDGAIWR